MTDLERMRHSASHVLAPDRTDDENIRSIVASISLVDLRH
jgi:hypothetical protein